MACDPQTFEHVTAAHWQTLKAGVHKHFGITMESDAGQDGKMGVTISWNYDEAAQRLVLACLEKPFFLKCDAINAQIADAVQRAKT
jgi:hypothetical protein